MSRNKLITSIGDLHLQSEHGNVHLHIKDGYTPSSDEPYSSGHVNILLNSMNNRIDQIQNIDGRTVSCTKTINGNLSGDVFIVTEIEDIDVSIPSVLTNVGKITQVDLKCIININNEYINIYQGIINVKYSQETLTVLPLPSYGSFGISNILYPQYEDKPGYTFTSSIFENNTLVLKIKHPSQININIVPNEIITVTASSKILLQ